MAEECWCGCGSRTSRNFLPGHDNVVAEMALEAAYGTRNRLELAKIMRERGVITDGRAEDDRG